MKTIILPTALLLALNCQANTNLPDMQMHVFNDESVTKNNPPALQMVIFSDDDSEQKEDKSQGNDFKLAYADNDQVSVYSDEPEVSHVAEHDDRTIDIEFYADAGYRQDKLDWNKASSTGTPNILSELTWDNIEIAVVEIGTSIHTPSNWVMDARFAYGTIFDGNNQDSDYDGNNRTQESFRGYANADEGNTIDTSIGFGYRALIIPAPARFKKPILSFTPKVGFSYHAQNLTMTDGQVVIPTSITVAELDSKYDTSWYGPWAGFDSELSIADRFSLTTKFEYHYAYYEATAEWNLRTDREQPKSFSHTAEGTGFLASLGSQYKLNKDLFLNVSVDYQDWRADKKGRTTEFFIDGSRSSQKLNEVNWESMGANIGLRYAF